MKIVFLILLFTQLYAFELQYLGLQEINANVNFDGHILGGLSQVQFKNNKLYTVTDDRGRNGGARIVVFNYLHQKKNWNQALKFEKSLKIEPSENSKILDLEAFYLFNDGKWIISSEGDLNQKPRVIPSIRFWDEKTKWAKSIPLPDAFIPESIGLQTKGLNNNSAFESLTVSTDESKMWVFSEGSLFQSLDSTIEVLEFKLNQLNEEPVRYKYLRDKAPEGRLEVFRGVSDALWLSDDQFLVLERYVYLTKKSFRQIEADLFLVKKTNDQFKKTKVLTLNENRAGNWEGLTLIQEKDQSTTLVILEDNNFDPKVSTKFIFYKLIK